MAKPLKRAPKGQVHTNYISAQRRVKTAERFVTRLVTDMVKGQMTAPAAADTTAGSVAPMVAGLALAAAAAPTPAPLGLTADATDELAQGAQSFGDVLKAIGNAVVISQAALDEAAIETAKQLSQTKLDVAVAVRQELKDDGNIDPAPGKLKIEKRTLSLSSFILPTLHQWQHVAVSMDLTVGEIDATAGIKVNSGGAGMTVATGGAGFSAAGEFNFSSINAESRYRGDFSSGAVRMDALLGPREEFRFPEIADFAIGPQILVTQTAITTAAVGTTPPSRKVTLAFKIVNRDGTPNAATTLDVQIPRDLRERLTGSVATGTGIASPIELTLAAAFLTDPTQVYRVHLKHGDLTKIVNVTI